MKSISTVYSDVGRLASQYITIDRQVVQEAVSDYFDTLKLDAMRIRNFSDADKLDAARHVRRKLVAHMRDQKNASDDDMCIVVGPATGVRIATGGRSITVLGSVTNSVIGTNAGHAKLDIECRADGSRCIRIETPPTEPSTVDQRVADIMAGVKRRIDAL